jgi:ketosteroid isomerase-like protein
LGSLVDSERAFARAAAELGTLTAFRTYLADDAVLFRPRALNAQQWLREAPDIPGLLSWEPVVADVSAAGDLGYTTGPWEYRQDPDGAVQSNGNYFTVWKKQTDGSISPRSAKRCYEWTAPSPAPLRRKAHCWRWPAT